MFTVCRLTGTDLKFPFFLGRRFVTNLKLQFSAILGTKSVSGRRTDYLNDFDYKVTTNQLTYKYFRRKFP